MAEAGGISNGVVPLCCGWEATVQRSYPRRRSGVLRIIEVILLSSMIAFLGRAPETSGYVTFMFAVTCLLLVTVVFIYLAHLLPLHHHQHCPPAHPRDRCCYYLPSILETLHDGVSSLVVLPAAILLLLLPEPSPPIAVAAVLAIVLVLLLSVQCTENLLRAILPSHPPCEDQGEMRQMEQITPPQDSQASPMRRYIPNTSRGRGSGSAKRWSKNRKNMSPPLPPLSPSSVPYSGSPVLTDPRPSIHHSSRHCPSSKPSSPPFSSFQSSRHLSSSKPFSPPLPSSHSPLSHPKALVSSQDFFPPSSINPSPPLFPSTSLTQSANESVITVPYPSSPVSSSPNTSPHLSSYSGVLLSSLSSSHTSVPQTSPHASTTYPSSLILSRPRTSSRIPNQSVILSSHSSPPPLPCDPSFSHLSSQNDISLSQSQDMILNNGYMESWHSDPPSPIYIPSPCPSPTDSSSTGPSPPHMQGPPPTLPSSTTSSLTTNTPIYANINHPCDVTFNITPYVSNHHPTVCALTHDPDPTNTHTTTPSPLINTPTTTCTTTHLDPIRPTINAIYATPCDASSALADNSPTYENVSSLTINTTTTTAVTTSALVSSCQSPTYNTALPAIIVTTTPTAESCECAHNSTSSSDHYCSPVSYL